PLRPPHHFRAEHTCPAGGGSKATDQRNLLSVARGRRDRLPHGGDHLFDGRHGVVLPGHLLTVHRDRQFASPSFAEFNLDTGLLPQRRRQTGGVLLDACSHGAVSDLHLFHRTCSFLGPLRMGRPAGTAHVARTRLPAKTRTTPPARAAKPTTGWKMMVCGLWTSVANGPAATTRS